MLPGSRFSRESSACRRFAVAGVAAVVVVLAVCSFSSLEYTELGLNYSMLTSTVEDRGYASGLYLLGPGHYFLKFPSTVQTIQFSHEPDSVGPPLRSRTNDGLEVALESSLQYQLNASALTALYRKYGMAYESIFVNIAMDLITQVATKYAATDFFSNRTTISLGMETTLKDTFESQAFANVPFFQLRSVSLPPEFEQAIQQTEVKKQDIQTAQAEKDNMQVQMETKVLQAQQQAMAIALAANATAQSTMLNMEAYVKQFGLAQRLQAQSFAPIHDKLKKNDTLLMDYMRARAMRDHPDHNSVVSISST